MKIDIISVIISIVSIIVSILNAMLIRKKRIVDYRILQESGRVMITKNGNQLIYSRVIKIVPVSGTIGKKEI
ncbi:hypothetical protein [Breznakia pachnodae]|uniref:Uncharacterized protein n=1 Tax=Breznakia pachnodae TaxID=265178 RepID=A0ABU0E6Q6_9FIRM|nr:hypothetical protein [Breznakia pachnodae]MDQ0362490.1 hypothetical protein [Breznakia pachnodae]